MWITTQSYPLLSSYYPQIVGNACFIQVLLLYFQRTYDYKSLSYKRIRDNLQGKERMWIHMETKLLLVDKTVDNLLTYPQIAQAAQLLRKNEVVAFPTETVYGLGGNAYNDDAISKIFAAKGRPADNPLIVHISDVEQVNDIADNISAQAALLMDKFWPGPLTLIFHNKSKQLSNKVTAGLSTVAVRMPNHPIALAIIREANIPIAAPSANQSGKPSPTSAQHVYADLNGKIAAIVDGGSTGVGVESTVVDCTVQPPQILRPGGISQEQIEAVIGKVQVDRALIDMKETPKSPGMKYRHYAPNVPLFLVEGSTQFLQQLVDKKRAEGLRVGVLTTEENKHRYTAEAILACGKREQPHTVASQLFATLRLFDQEKVDIIFAETFPKSGIGSAIMNRLGKASGQQIIKENN